MRLKLLFIYVTVAAFFAAGTIVRAQSFEPFNPYGIFSPSVETWQMTRCGNLLPSLYTGAMTFSLPLMTYSDPDFTIPVTLEYSFDGYKPGQHSGSVGYGWYLDCGGVITREVRGIPDEGDLDGGIKYPCSIHGWRQAGSFRDSLEVHSGSLYSIRRKTVDYVPVGDCIGLLEGYDPFSDTPMYASPTGYRYNLYDTAPDIYHFRFLGHSGDFMMLPDGSVRVYNSDIPHGELSVAFTDNANAPWSTVITLTTGDGYEYRFECGDLAETPDCNGDHPHRVSKSVSGYHLTRITAPNGRNASFAYTEQKIPVITPRYGTILEGVCNTNGVWESEVYYNLFSSGGEPVKWTFIRESSHNLEKITVNDTTGLATADSLVFRYAHLASGENDRTCFEQADLSCFEWLGDPKRLASVSMYGDDGLADAVSFTYLYASNGTPKAFLESVTGMKTGTHTFYYNLSGFVLPPNDTQNTDHWGYWNGSSITDLRAHLTETAWMFQQGPGMEISLPDDNTDSTYVVILPDTTIVRRCATHLYDQMTDNAKEANAVSSVCGALTRILYPHGGSTVVEYEPNGVTRRMNVQATETVHLLEAVDSLDATTVWTVGGVRVKQLVDTDGHGKADTTRISYTDPEASGRCSGILMTMPKYAEVVQYDHHASCIYEFNGMVGTANVNAIGFNNCCGITLNRDPHVVYPAVTVIYPDGSRTEHRYTSVADPGRNDSHAILFSIPKHIFGPSDSFEYNSRTPTCMIPASLDCRNLRGQPLCTIVRDDAGLELKRTEYDYAYDQVTIPRLCFNNILTYSLATYVVRSPRIVSTTETDHGLTTRTDHTYNALGQVKTTSTTGGAADSDTLRTTLHYRHESGDTSPYRALPDAAAKTRVCAGGGEYLLAREQYAYKPGTPRLSGITSFMPDSPVPVEAPATPFSVAAGTGRISTFNYNANQRLTKASFPGKAYISYTWNGNHLTSKTVDGLSNTTLFDWKDLVGLTQVESPSGQTESYQYDDRNRPWKTLDSDSLTVSVFHYHLKNE